MKKFFMMFTLMVAIYSCSKSDDGLSGGGDGGATEEPSGDGISITANVDLLQQNPTSNTRISSDFGATDADTWAFTWDANDVIYAFCIIDDGSRYQTVPLTSADLEAGTDNATFTGTLPSGTTAYRLIYASEGIEFNAGSIDKVTSANGPVTINPTGDGKMPFVMASNEQYQVAGGALSVSIQPEMKHLCSFIEVETNFVNSSEYYRDIKVESITLEGLYNSDGYNLNSDDDGVSDLLMNNPSNPSQTLTLTNPVKVANGKQSYYFAIFNSAIKADGEISATFNLSDNSSFEVKKQFKNGASFTTPGTFSTFEAGYDFIDSNIDKESVVNNVTTTVCAMEYHFNGGATDFNPDTENLNYSITSAKDLMALSSLINSKEDIPTGTTFTLKQDINLTGIKWSPIGYKSDNAFSAIFDGNGKTISNCTAQMSNYETQFGSVGLFGYISGAKAVVKNLIVKDANLYTKVETKVSHVGTIAGTINSSATIINCGVDYTSGQSTGIIAYYQGAFGGIVGVLSGASIKNSYSNADVNCDDEASVLSGEQVNMGGICGSIEANSVIDNCYFAGTFDGAFTGEGDTAHLSKPDQLLSGMLIGAAGDLSSCMITSAFYCSTDYAGLKALGDPSDDYSKDLSDTNNNRVTTALSAVQMQGGLVAMLNYNIDYINDAKEWESVSGFTPTLKF